MKKIYLIPVMIMMLAAAGWAQKSSQGSAKSPLGDNGKCIKIEFEGQKKNVEDVLKKKFKKLKNKKEKGYEAFKAQIFPEISSQTLDIYYKVNKKGDDKSEVVMFLSTGYDNWLDQSEHGAEINNCMKMLDGLVAEVRKYELELAIGAQTKILEDAVKEQEKLVSENEKLKKELEKLQKEIEENKQNTEDNLKAQEDQKKTVEDEKKVLDELQKKLGQVK